MKKSIIFFTIAIILFIVSIIIFSTVKTEKSSICRNIECSNYLKFGDAFPKSPFRLCNLSCMLEKDDEGNPITINYTKHNPIYVFPLYLSIILLIIAIISIVRKK